MTARDLGRQSGINHQPVGHIELHIQAVLTLTATAASLYSLGRRAKAEQAHVEAELSYTRLLVRLSGFGGIHSAWSQAGLHDVQEALQHLPKSATDILGRSTATSTPYKVAMFYTAAST